MAHQPYNSDAREWENANLDTASNHANPHTSSTTAGGRHHHSHPRDLDVASGADEHKSGRNCCSPALNLGKRVVYTILPPGGVLSSAFNMASGSIGAGILGLAGATDSAGLLLAIIYLVIITFFSVYSMRILAITAEKTRLRSFEALARWLFPYGNYAFSYWCAFIRWFHAFAGNVAYIISIGNCFKPLFDTAHKNHPDDKAIKYFATTSGNRLLTSLVWICIMLPLVIPKHIDSLRYASAFAVTFMIYFVIIIVVHSGMNGLTENASKVRATDASGYNPDTDDNAIFLFRKGNSVVNSVGVFMFAYVCQINALEIHTDMRPEIRTTRNYTWAAFIGMLICGILYLLVCIFGYFDFGSKYLRNQSILLMYDPLKEPAVLIAYIGVMCKLCVAYALLTIAARNSIYYIIGWQRRYAPKSDRVAATHVEAMVNREMENNEYNGREGREGATTKPLASGDAYAEDPDALGEDLEVANGFDDANKNEKADATVPPEYHHVEPDEEAAHDDANDTTYVDNIPFWQHLIVVVVLSVASLLCGLFIPSINMVFGFAGAISGGFLAFIFPALFFMYSGNWTLRTVGFWDYFLTYALLITGVIGIIFGTGGTIYNQI